MTASAKHERAVPSVVALYGGLGLIPFLVPPIVGWIVPSAGGLASTVLIVYGAVILSFLGGARWGLAVRQPLPNPLTISLAMLPSLVALALVATPYLTGHMRLLGLAAGLALQWSWDIGSSDLMPWYPRLRTALTIGAVVGLLLGAFMLPG